MSIVSSRARIRTTCYNVNNRTNNVQLRNAVNASDDVRLQRSLDKASLEEAQLGVDTDFQAAIEDVMTHCDTSQKAGATIYGGNRVGGNVFVAGGSLDGHVGHHYDQNAVSLAEKTLIAAHPKTIKTNDLHLKDAQAQIQANAMNGNIV